MREEEEILALELEPAPGSAEEEAWADLGGLYPAVDLGGRKALLLPAERLVEVEARLEELRRAREAREGRPVVLRYRVGPLPCLPRFGADWERWQGARVFWEEAGAEAQGPLAVRLELRAREAGYEAELVLDLGPHRVAIGPGDRVADRGDTREIRAGGRRITLRRLPAS